MRVDDPRRDEAARDIHDVGVRGDLDVRADRRDLSVAEQYRPVRDRATRHRQNRAPAEGDDAALRGAGLTRGSRSGGGNEGEGQDEGAQPASHMSAIHDNLQCSESGEGGRPDAAAVTKGLNVTSPARKRKVA